MGTLINPNRPNPQAEKDFNPFPTFLRNPRSGIVYKLYHKDTIERCLREGFGGATEADLLAQVPEFEELQGRKFTPEAATEPEPPSASVHAPHAARTNASAR